MLTTRLSLAAERGLFHLDGPVCVFGARAGDDLSPLGTDVQVVQDFHPDFDVLSRRGLDVRVAPEGRFPLIVVALPRAKALARDRVARAAPALAPGGVLVIDGQKTEGIDSLLRDIRKRAEVGEVLSKAHGKIFTVTGGEFSDWVEEPARISEGFLTAPGSFSADAVDRGSALLAEALPPLKGAVADLGAGWGYLSHHLLQTSQAVTECHLVEADHAALDCARTNVTDPRARFHWADATAWDGPEPLDHVVTNPPFHIGRAADPSLGRAFIAAAVRLLKPSGRLWLVANRHLPYEAALSEGFARIEEVAGDNAFKVYACDRPRRGR